MWQPQEENQLQKIPDTPRAHLLSSVIKITSTRHSSSGVNPNPIQDFEICAQVWTGLFSTMLKPGVRFEPHHVAMAMEALKLARTIDHPENEDNWADSAGYAACGWECVVRAGVHLVAKATGGDEADVNQHTVQGQRQ